MTNLRRVWACGRVSQIEGGEVHLKHSGGDGRAGFGGLVTCGSVWACPVCSAKIAARRTAEITQALDWNAARGGSVALITLTMRHHRGHRLADLWDGLSAAWRHMTSHRSWSAERRRLGADHYIRAVEATHGESGWHIHAHVLVFLDGPVSRDILGVWADDLYERWSEGLSRRGFGASRAHGVDVRQGTGAVDRLRTYLTKIALETAGARFKRGRSGSRTPYEILEDGLSTGLASDIELWWEWESASRGRRQLTWSRGLKVAAAVDEVTDQEAAEDDLGGQTVCILPARTWRAVEPQAEELLAVTTAWGPEGAYRWLDRRELAYEIPDRVAYPSLE